MLFVYTEVCHKGRLYCICVLYSILTTTDTNPLLPQAPIGLDAWASERDGKAISLLMSGAVRLRLGAAEKRYS